MNTTISISKKTRKILQDIGRKSETYDQVIQRMHNTLLLREKLEEYMDQQSYSSLEDAEEWTKMKIKLE